MFNVVHLCLTPLAGAPIRLVKALNKCGTPARLINLNPRMYGARTFQEDIDFNESPDEARELIFKADIIHLHHWMDLKSNPFGIDLSDKKVVRHFHYRPEFIARLAGLPLDHIVNDPLPQIVVGQFQERYYPRARPVPNLINLDVIDDILRNSNLKKEDGSVQVSFFPTVNCSAFAERWDTKGKEETIKIMSNFKPPDGMDFEFSFFMDLPHQRSLELKSCSDIVFDEMVTGSYHLSGLEGLALGKPTFGYLDQRTLAILSTFSGTSSVPWVNTHLSSLTESLHKILGDRALLKSVGDFSRKWILKYWRPENLIAFYLSVYVDALNGRTLLHNAPAKPMPDIKTQDKTWKQHMAKLERQLSSPLDCSVA